MSKKRRPPRHGRTAKATPVRRFLRWAGAGLLLVFCAYAALGVWFVHHPRKWFAEAERAYPSFVTRPLYWIGNPLGDLTDALNLTGHDAVYEFDEEAPEGSVLFAGAPRRVGVPAPHDIRIIDRGEFVIGWSESLRHPVWCAYHVVSEGKHQLGKRPNFKRDKEANQCPGASAYERSGYDRGHMVPNFAIGTRYGDEMRRATFLMSNIAPQTPALNRGVWRDVEHRIAELWTARYGEIWVIVGCISPTANHETLSGTDVDVPTQFYQIIVAQEGMDVRAQAVVFPQNVPWNAWPTRNLITIDELETLTGLDFLPELPSFIQDPLEAELPSRLWPIRKRDIFKQIAIRYFYD